MLGNPPQDGPPMRTRILPHPTVFALLLAGCGAAAPAPRLAEGPQVAEVVTTDYAFTMPDTLAAGWTSFRMRNEGADIHHVTLVRLEEGKSLEDLLAALGPGEAFPAWATFVGGPNVAMGSVSDVTLELMPGTYAALCVIPAADGQPHLAKGMMKTLTVVPSEVTYPPPVETVTLTLKDYGYEWSAPPASGRQVVRVLNVANQPHEAVLARLEAGRTAEEMGAFIQAYADLGHGGAAPAGPPPGMFVGGIAAMAPGQVNYLTLDLATGEYAQLCVVPDHQDGRPHTAHGMVAALTIP